MKESQVELLILYSAVACSMFLAISGLVAYIPGFEVLGRVRPDYIPMAPSTALSFMMLSFLLLFVQRGKQQPLVVGLLFLSVSLVGTFGLLELVGFLLEMDLNFEDVIVPKLGELKGIPVGRMSPSTGGLFFLSSISLFVLFLCRSMGAGSEVNVRKISGGISSLIMLIASTILLGYLYGTPFFYGQRTIPMALTTALGFMALSVGLIVANGRDYYPLNAFVGSSTAVRLKRLFLPLIVAFILIQGSLTILLKPLVSGLNEAFVTAIIVILYVFVFGIVINKVSKVVGGQIDKTERLLREAERQLSMAHRLEAIGQLASGIAHEINTPLQYVGGNLHFMKQALPEIEQACSKLQLSTDESKSERDDEESSIDKHVSGLVEEYGAAVSESINGLNHISTIVRAMKKSSHPASAATQLADFNELVETSLLVSRNEWKYVAEVDLDLDESLQAISCSPAGMTQVVLNLLLNAAQAIDSKNKRVGPKGIITIKTYEEDGMLVLSIHDDGCGIAQEHWHRVYDPFFTTKGIGKGTGQGLSIVYDIVKKHKGSIELDSQLGVGTTFTVRLPF
ncbi:ATP-binding protein [Pseudodesulfovibrio sp. zrk46]|uniref:sensor histidine kinase n=1 Tax=Pseudodesulfovibrio sp. zrk46 TaxID=2725288 RepID=UPI00144A25D4|nr:ATP-binding protein [Pseudodesulfovibrio sp. zrk46]QJB56749.1 GHKL domain-containing protein [Pseudodesulfovibrio sp. zrk46]